MTRSNVFGYRLRLLRDLHGYTQAYLAERVGADNVQISRYETGVIGPSVDTLVKLADVFGCSTDFLLGRSESPRITELSSTDLKPDQRRLLQAINERDIHGTFLVLSLLFSAPEPRPLTNVQKALLHRGVTLDPAKLGAELISVHMRESADSSEPREIRSTQLAGKERKPE
jgi:transcriptional regulator with XRE-family HTH domain